MYKQLRILNKNTNEIFYGQIDTELEGHDFYNLVEIPDDGNLYKFVDGDIIEDTEIEAVNEKVANNAKIQSEIADIDIKRIRAIVEGGSNSATGKTYLDEYTEQIVELRAQLL
jgi:hypothetical protein